MTDNALLEIDGLKTYFRSDAGTIRAVDDLSVKIRFGQTLGLVGESGSGKSVTSLTSGHGLKAAEFRSWDEILSSFLVSR